MTTQLRDRFELLDSTKGGSSYFTWCLAYSSGVNLAPLT